MRGHADSGCTTGMSPSVSTMIQQLNTLFEYLSIIYT